MNIGVDLRCLQSSPRTGVGEYAFELVREILQQDRTNRYFLFFNASGHIDLPEFNFPNATIARFSYPNKFLSLCSLVFKYPKLDKLIAKRFKLDKLDLFYSPHLNFTALSPDTKHVITIHDLTFELFPQFLTLKQKLWHRLTSAKAQCQSAWLVLCPSDNTRRDVVDQYKTPESKVKTVYPGVSASFLNNRTNYRKDGKYILFLGTVEPRKNIISLVKAFEDVSKQLPEYRLVIAGARGWKNKYLIKRIQTSKCATKIECVGYVPDEDKARLYQDASVFVYPSFYEGFGFPVLEAMASGVPVVTSNRSSLSEITDGAAALINPNRPEQISQAILRILKDQTFRCELANKGSEKAREFTWRRAAQAWLKMTK